MALSVPLLTVTDVEISGDRFMIDVNGSPATAPVGNPGGLTPAGQQAVGAMTSAPKAFVSCGPGDPEDISACLADSNYSSGTFLLPPGSDTITGTYLGTISNGNMDLIVEPKSVPEPTTLSVLGVGLVCFEMVRRWRRRSA